MPRRGDYDGFCEKLPNYPQARQCLEIDLDAVPQQLENEGVEKFEEPFEVLIKTPEQKRAAVRG